MSRERLNTRLIQINLDYLEEVEMDMNQYLSLMKLYSYPEEGNLIPIKVHQEDLDFLITNGYIIKDDYTVSLTDKGRSIFESDNDLFEEFFSIYPHKVPDGVGSHRVIGTAKVDTVFGNKMRKKWKNITKNNKQLQQDMITALKYELNYRKKTGSLTYMQGMEVWFNKATWEKYLDAANEDAPKREDKIL